jgi:hypothetical protein
VNRKAALVVVALVAVLLLVSGSGSNAADAGDLQTFFIIARDAIPASQALEATGDKPLHVFPPHVIFAKIHDPKALSAADFLFASQGPVEPSAMAPLGPVACMAAEAWNRNIMGLAPLSAESTVEPPPIANDVRRVENLSPTVGLERLLAAPYGAGRYDTSEFMIGKIAIGIFILESTGAIDPSTENWTSSRASQVISQIQAAMTWWQNREPSANLTFVYDIHYPANTSYEPINRPSTDDVLWVSQVLGNLGYTDTGADPTETQLQRAYSYLNHIRDSLATDWATAVFVADSLNSTTGMFTDGWFAYAYFGGPFAVMTYDNDGYTISGMAATMAHEFGHLFYALDEYSGSDGCSERSGYFNSANCNAVDCPPPTVACIMRGQISPYTQGAVCRCTHLQIGHRDSDADGIEDILDVPPVGTLVPFSPDPAPTGNLTYAGSGTVSTLPNLNAQPAPSSHPAITLNKIAAAQFRVDGGPWQSAAASDGSFDEPTEQFTFSVTVTAGTHLIEARVRDSAGNYQLTPASDSITVTGGPGYPTVSLTSPTGGATLHGTTYVSASASDDVGVSRVEFIVDSVIQQVDTSAPYEWYWNTYLTPDGTHLLSARAVDADGRSSSDTISVNVENATFDDVPATNMFWAHVEAIYRDGITSGCAASPPLYCPNASVTRAQMAKFLCLAAGKAPLNSAVPTFADVPKTLWAYGYIERLADPASWPGGIPPTSGCACPSGYPQGTRCFCPFDPVTREQMAKFLCLAAGQSPMPSCSGKFCDVPSSDTFCPFVERLADGPSWPGGVPVTGGCACPLRYAPACKCYCPGSPVTRGQMAKFLVLAFGIPL